MSDKRKPRRNRAKNIRTGLFFAAIAIFFFLYTLYKYRVLE